MAIESKAVLELFPDTLEIFPESGGYLDVKHGELSAFSEDLMAEFMRESNEKNKNAMRVALGNFVKARSVLPIPQMPLD